LHRIQIFNPDYARVEPGKELDFVVAERGVGMENKWPWSIVPVKIVVTRSLGERPPQLTIYMRLRAPQYNVATETQLQEKNHPSNSSEVIALAPYIGFPLQFVDPRPDATFVIEIRDNDAQRKLLINREIPLKFAVDRDPGKEFVPHFFPL
jgi:hypothetical protein